MQVEHSLSFLRLQYLVLLFSPYLPECTILPQRLQVNSSAMGQASKMQDKSGTQLPDQGRSEKLPATENKNHGPFFTSNVAQPKCSAWLDLENVFLNTFSIV
jgi:hypothetical protein